MFAPCCACVGAFVLIHCHTRNDPFCCTTTSRSGVDAGGCACFAWPLGAPSPSAGGEDAPAVTGIGWTKNMPTMTESTVLSARIGAWPGLDANASGPSLRRRKARKRSASWLVISDSCDIGADGVGIVVDIALETAEKTQKTRPLLNAPAKCPAVTAEEESTSGAEADRKEGRRGVVTVVSSVGVLPCALSSWNGAIGFIGDRTGPAIGDPLGEPSSAQWRDEDDDGGAPERHVRPRRGHPMAATIAAASLLVGVAPVSVGPAILCQANMACAGGRSPWAPNPPPPGSPPSRFFDGRA